MKAKRQTNQHRKLKQQVADLQAEVRRLKDERYILAMLSAETPQFYNPLQVMAAKQVCDQVLAEALDQKGA